jgi:hypothetical protein
MKKVGITVDAGHLLSNFSATTTTTAWLIDFIVSC